MLPQTDEFERLLRRRQEMWEAQQRALAGSLILRNSLSQDLPEPMATEQANAVAQVLAEPPREQTLREMRNMDDLIAAGRAYGIRDPEKIPISELGPMVQERRDAYYDEFGQKNVWAELGKIGAVSAPLVAIGMAQESLRFMGNLAERIPFIGDAISRGAATRRADQFFSELEEGLLADVTQDRRQLARGVAGAVGMFPGAIFGWEAMGLAGSVPLAAKIGARISPLGRAAIRGAAGSMLVQDPTAPLHEQGVNAALGAFYGAGASRGPVGQLFAGAGIGTMAGALASEGDPRAMLIGGALGTIGVLTHNTYLNRIRRSFPSSALESSPRRPARPQDGIQEAEWSFVDDRAQLTPGVRATPATPPAPRGAPPTGPTQGGQPTGPYPMVWENTPQPMQEFASNLMVENRGLQRQLETNPLTGVGSRLAWMRAQGQAENDPSKVIVSHDIGNFKAPNDVYGHEFGDELLKKAATAIPGGRVFHVGGDEFISIHDVDKVDAELAQAQQNFGTLDVNGFPVQLFSGRGQTFQQADDNLRQLKGEAPRPVYRPLDSQGATGEASMLSKQATIIESPAVAELSLKPALDDSDVARALVDSYPGQVGVIQNVRDPHETLRRILMEQMPRGMGPQDFRVIDRGGRLDVLVSAGRAITNKMAKDYKESGVFVGQRALVSTGQEVVIESIGPEMTVVKPQYGGPAVSVPTSSILPSKSSYLLDNVPESYTNFVEYAQGRLNQQSMQIGAIPLQLMSNDGASQVPLLMNEYIGSLGIDPGSYYGAAVKQLLEQKHIEALRDLAPEADKAILRNVQNELQEMDIRGAVAGMMTSEGTVGAGMDPSLVRKMGANMYDSNLALVTTKELFQNAFDAVRPSIQQALGRQPSSGKIKLDYNSNTNTVRIEDNGVGMSPSVAANQFMDPGGSFGKDIGMDASGQFGMAKVGFFLYADDIKVDTIGIDENGQYWHTKIRGDGEKWLAKKLTFEPKQVPPQQTGTRIEIQLGPSARAEGQTARSFMQQTGTYSKGPEMEFSYDDVPLQFIDDQYRTVKAGSGMLPPTDTMPFPGGVAEVGYSKELSEYGTTVHILNNGLYQFSDSFSQRKQKLPRTVIFNVKANVGTDNPDYPFTTSRESLRGGGADAYKAMKGNLQLAAAKEQIAFLGAHLENVMVAPGTQYGVYRTDDKIPEDFRRALSERPYVKTLLEGFGELAESLRHFIHERAWRLEGLDFGSGQGGRPLGPSNLNKFQFGGVGTEKGWLGLNISRDMIDRLTDTRPSWERIKDQTTLSKPNLILLNPWSMIEEASLVSPKNKNDFHGLLSSMTIKTMTHEIAHQMYREHDDPFTAISERVNELFIENTELTEALHAKMREVWGKSFPGVFSDLSKIKESWGGKSLFEGVSSHRGTGSSGDVPGGYEQGLFPGAGEELAYGGSSGSGSLRGESGAAVRGSSAGGLPVEGYDLGTDLRGTRGARISDLAGAKGFEWQPARTREMLYHGSPGLVGDQLDPNMAGGAVWLTADPSEASNYAMGGRPSIERAPSVTPVQLTAQNPINYHQLTGLPGENDLLARARAAGYDAVRFPDDRVAALTAESMQSPYVERTSGGTLIDLMSEGDVTIPFESEDAARQFLRDFHRESLDDSPVGDFPIEVLETPIGYSETSGPTFEMTDEVASEMASSMQDDLAQLYAQMGESMFQGGVGGPPPPGGAPPLGGSSEQPFGLFPSRSTKDIYNLAWEQARTLHPERVRTMADAMAGVMTDLFTPMRNVALRLDAMTKEMGVPPMERMMVNLQNAHTQHVNAASVWEDQAFTALHGVRRKVIRDGSMWEVLIAPPETRLRLAERAGFTPREKEALVELGDIFERHRMEAGRAGYSLPDNYLHVFQRVEEALPGDRRRVPKQATWGPREGQESDYIEKDLAAIIPRYFRSYYKAQMMNGPYREMKAAVAGKDVPDIIKDLMGKWADDRMWGLDPTSDLALKAVHTVFNTLAKAVGTRISKAEMAGLFQSEANLTYGAALGFNPMAIIRETPQMFIGISHLGHDRGIPVLKRLLNPEYRAQAYEFAYSKGWMMRHHGTAVDPDLFGSAAFREVEPDRQVSITQTGPMQAAANTLYDRVLTPLGMERGLQHSKLGPMHVYGGVTEFGRLWNLMSGYDSAQQALMRYNAARQEGKKSQAVLEAELLDDARVNRYQGTIQDGFMEYVQRGDFEGAASYFARHVGDEQNRFGMTEHPPRFRKFGPFLGRRAMRWQTFNSQTMANFTQIGSDKRIPPKAKAAYFAQVGALQGAYFVAQRLTGWNLMRLSLLGAAFSFAGTGIWDWANLLQRAQARLSQIDPTGRGANPTERALLGSVGTSYGNTFFTTDPTRALWNPWVGAAQRVMGAADASQYGVEGLARYFTTGQTTDPYMDRMRQQMQGGFYNWGPGTPGGGGQQ